MRKNVISIKNFSSGTSRDMGIYVKKIKGKGHPITGQEGPDGGGG
jgi:hypothetical protein